MIGSVEIKNFKSIRDLSFQPRRVNLFIGEPNTGKSNVIEALAFFSPGVFKAFQEMFRFRTTADLFFDQRVTNELSVQAGDWRLSLKLKGTQYQGAFSQGQGGRGGLLMNHAGLVEVGGPQGPRGPQTPFKYYVFKSLPNFPNVQPGVLTCPFGDNLVAVLYSNESLRQRVGALIRSRGFRLQLKPTENELLITKDVNDELYSYPWASVSETLRRVVFLMAVLETNQDAVLLLDEPETNTFPFYTKYLAERIALDETNQFFITTHNPYLLSSIVEKTKPGDLAVFVARMEDFETKLKLIPDQRLPELLELDSDAFFNLERLVQE